MGVISDITASSIKKTTATITVEYDCDRNEEYDYISIKGCDSSIKSSSNSKSVINLSGLSSGSKNTITVTVYFCEEDEDGEYVFSSNDTDKITLYTKGPTFSFNFNINDKNQWDISQPLITNVDAFNEAARIYKQWYTQSSASAGKLKSGTLTASNLKETYSDVYGSISCSKGDKVTKAMFTNLAALINK